MMGAKRVPRYALFRTVVVNRLNSSDVSALESSITERFHHLCHGECITDLVDDTARSTYIRDGEDADGL